jgi:UDPglucose 6-dehydrogenase
MKVTVFGAGYVGLVSAASFAQLGNDVLCLENDAEKLQKLREGVLPIFEPELAELMAANVESGRLRFTDNANAGIDHGDVMFICVGTPQGEDGRSDLSQVESVARQIASHITKKVLIVEKSTVPVNTHQWVSRTIRRHVKSDAEFEVASNPEFLREGTAVHDFFHPDRIVVGVESGWAENLLRSLYEPLTSRGTEILVTKVAEAELIKHASNSFLALKISFINMVSELCEKTGADIKRVAKGVGMDRRIGEKFLQAGIGYGGSCFPKDLQAFIRIAQDNGMEFELLKETERINRCQRERFVKLIEEVLWINKHKTLAVWGLAFKADTDDIREAPSLFVVGQLLRAGAKLSLFDPKGSANFRRSYPESDSISYFTDKYEAARGADALIVLTDWSEFIEADLSKVKSLLALPILIDGRNIYEPATMASLGFEYYSVGR